MCDCNYCPIREECNTPKGYSYEEWLYPLDREDCPLIKGLKKLELLNEASVASGKEERE